MTENAGEAARKLRDLERFRIYVMTSGAFKVTAKNEKKAEKSNQAEGDLRRNLTEKGVLVVPP